MMENDLLQRARNLLSDPAVIDQPVSWWANGRGIRHAYVRCRKLRRSTSLAKVQESAQSVIDSKRTCYECFEDGVTSPLPAADQFRKLLRIADDVEHNARTADRTDEVRQLHWSIRSLRSSLVGLARLNDDSAAVSEYGTAIEDLIVKTRTAIDRARQKIGLQRENLIRPVALTVMSPSGYGKMDGLMTKEELTLLSTGSYSSRGPTQLFDAWNRGQLAQASLEQRLSDVLDVASRMQLESIAQMRGVPVTADGSVDLETAARASWARQRDAVVTDLVARWDAKLAEILADSYSVLVAFHGGERSDDLVGYVVEAHTICEHTDPQVRVLRAPLLVANWLASTHTTVHYGTRQPLVQVCEEDADVAVAETAASLWDPATSGSPYLRFRDCVTAAKALLA